MKILISILITIALSACSSFEDNVELMYQVDTIHCNGSGFKAYAEVGDSVVFTCGNSTRGRIEKP